MNKQLERTEKTVVTTATGDIIASRRPFGVPQWYTLSVVSAVRVARHPPEEWPKRGHVAC